MDPQKLSQLDPKLRDAYQRVMGTTIPQSQAAPAAQTQIPQPLANEPATPPFDPNQTPQSQPNPAPAPASPIEEPTAPQAPVSQKSEPFFKPQSEEATSTPQPTVPQQASNFVQMNSEVSVPTPVSSPNLTAPAAFDPAPAQAQVPIVPKKGNMFMPVIIGISILVFTVAYGLFWARILNFKLPFLP